MTGHRVDPDEHEKRQAEKKAAAQRRKETEDTDMVWLMSTRQGRRIVWRLLEAAGVYRSTYNSDAMAMAFAEGNRNNGLRLMAWVSSLCPNQYLDMIKEANDDADD